MHGLMISDPKIITHRLLSFQGYANMLSPGDRMIYGLRETLDIVFLMFDP